MAALLTEPKREGKGRCCLLCHGASGSRDEAGIVKLRADTDDPVLSEYMKLIGTADSAVAITEALEGVLRSKKRQAEVKAKYEAWHNKRDKQDIERPAAANRAHANSLPSSVL